VQEPATNDDLREGFLETFRSDLGDGFVSSYLVPGDSVWVRVTSDAWVEAGLIARDKLRCDYFCFLSGMDWMPSPFGRSEDSPVDDRSAAGDTPTQMVTGYSGGDTRFQIFARVVSLSQRAGIFLKADLDDDHPSVATWTSTYAGANWHEREAHEMFGIDFVGHPHLAPLYLPSGFEGHPLRKDFPLLARQVKPWPGIVDVEPMPGDSGGSADEETS